MPGGLESFRQRFPADDGLRPQLERMRASRSGRSEPLHILLVKNLLTASSEELREALAGMSGQGAEIAPTNLDFMAMPDDIREKTNAALGGVALAVSILSLHEVLLEQTFDVGLWVNRYNEAKKGTYLQPVRIASGVSPTEPVPAEKWKQMIQVLNKDKSFGRFFYDDIQYMPDGLLRILNESGLFPFITQYALPIYREHAKFLE